MNNDFLICVLVLFIIFTGIYFIEENSKSKKKLDENKIDTVSSINHLISQYNIKLSETDSIFREVNIELASIRPNYSMICKIEECNDTLHSLANSFNKRLNNVKQNLNGLKYDDLYDIKNGLQEDLYFMENTIDKLKILLEEISAIKIIEGKEKKETKEYITDNVYSSVFFRGCNDIETLEKRYKMLIKIYHPDNRYGDNEAFLSIQSEYSKMKQKLEG